MTHFFAKKESSSVPVCKKNPHRLPLHCQPPLLSQTTGERDQSAHIAAIHPAYHISNPTTERRQQPCPRNHPPHCPKNHPPRPRPSSSGVCSPPAPPYVFDPDSPKASKQATKISIPVRVSLQSVLPVFCSLSFWKLPASGGCGGGNNFRRACI